MHLNKTEGRDKLFKAIQFWTRFLAYHTSVTDEALSKRLTLLWRGILQARKIFWMGKSIIEFQQVKDLLLSKAADETDRMLRVFQRAFLGLRWAMENVEVLGRMGVIKIDYVPFLLFFHAPNIDFMFEFASQIPILNFQFSKMSDDIIILSITIFDIHRIVR